jgi:hypothetical protein
MLGVEGQYRASFSIAGQKDFLGEQQVVSFKMIEDVGNALPIFEIVFDLFDENLLKYLNEEHTVTISMGSNLNQLTDSVFIPTKVVPTRTGEHSHRIRMLGIYSKLPYITKSKLKITDKKKSYEAIQEVVESNNFTFKTNITSDDRMNWIQPNITDRAFVSHIWGHTYIEDSFPAIGITLDGEFRYLDLKKAAKEPYKFRFNNTEQSNKDIIYEKDYRINTNSTFLNQISSYGKQKLVANLEEGTFT